MAKEKYLILMPFEWLPYGSEGEESACSTGEPGFDPWVGKITWRREELPTLVFLPGESHGQRSLVGDSPWGRKESDMSEQLTLSCHLNPGVTLIQSMSGDSEAGAHVHLLCTLKDPEGWLGGPGEPDASHEGPACSPSTSG